MSLLQQCYALTCYTVIVMEIKGLSVGAAATDSDRPLLVDILAAAAGSKTADDRYVVAAGIVCLNFRRGRGTCF